MRKIQTALFIATLIAHGGNFRFELSAPAQAQFASAFSGSGEASKSDAPTCQDQSVIADIQRFIECQQGWRLDSCAGVLWGKGERKSRPTEPENSNGNVDSVSLADLSQMSDADWDYAIETRLRIDSHGLLHAHEPIDPLSRQLIKGKNQSAVSMALNQIIIPAIQTVAKKSVVSHFKGKIRSAVLAEIKKYAFFLRDEMVRRAVASGYLVTTVAVGAEKTAAAAAAAENLFAWRLLGIVTGPLMTYLSTTTPLACDGVSDAVINTVPESGGLGCKPRYELNRTTMNFIYNFPEKTRRQYLARQDVCMFYQTLRNRYYTVPRFRQLRCESSRITVKGTDAVGKSVELKIILGRTATATSAIQSHAQKLYLKENEAVAADFDISETGLITHASDPKNALLSIRLYAQEAIQCCLEGRHDPALMRNCQKWFPGAEGL